MEKEKITSRQIWFCGIYHEPFFPTIKWAVGAKIASTEGTWKCPHCDMLDFQESVHEYVGYFGMTTGFEFVLRRVKL